jgi:hypothetical protein
MTTALRQPRGAAGAGGANKLPQVDRDAAAIAKQIVDLRNVDPNNKQIPMLESKLTALKEIIATTKTSDIGANKLGIDTQKILSNASLKSGEEASKAARAEMTNKDLWGTKNQQAAFDEIYKQKYSDLMGQHATSIGIDKNKLIENTTMPAHGVNFSNPNAAPAKATTGATGVPDIKSVTGAPAGATIGRQTIQGYEILDSSGKLIGYAKGKS